MVQLELFAGFRDTRIELQAPLFLCQEFLNFLGEGDQSIEVLLVRG